MKTQKRYWLWNQKRRSFEFQLYFLLVEYPATAAKSLQSC